MILEEIKSKFNDNKESLKVKDSEITLLIEDLLKDDSCFLKISMDLALNMLLFIGYSKEDSKNVYVELMKECSNDIKGKYKLFNLDD